MSPKGSHTWTTFRDQMARLGLWLDTTGMNVGETVDKNMLRADDALLG